ncbi:MAG: FKBP-type peptidyl-prolyl cis-trans isomerase [bacterium]
MQNQKNMGLVISAVVCVAFVGVLIFISLNKKENNMNSNDNMPSANNVNPASGVAKTGDTVSMNYTGRLQNGTVFDSNVDPKFNHVEPFIFTLGAGRVIAGWDKGIVGMKVGEKKTLTISPDDGYGPRDVKDRAGKVIIPANSTLVFDVELVSIKN